MLSFVTASQSHPARDQIAGNWQGRDSDPRTLLLESLFPYLQGGGGRGRWVWGCLERKLLEPTWVKCWNGAGDDRQEAERITT